MKSPKSFNIYGKRGIRMDNLKIPYVRNGDYYIPYLTLKPQAPLGKYGRCGNGF